MRELSTNKGIIKIREAKTSDAPAIIDYINKIGGESDFLTFGESEFHISIEKEEEIINNALNKKNAVFLVAEIEGKVVGNLNFSGGHRARIEHTGEFGVSVSKAYWGLGIGKVLIEELITKSKELKIIKKINLRVRTDNERGIKLYKKLGFKEEGIITRDFFIKGKFYDSLCMGLEID